MTLTRRHRALEDRLLRRLLPRRREKGSTVPSKGELVMSAIARTAFGSLWVALLLLKADPASAFLAFVSNEKGNSISVVDTDKMETVATIPTGQRPRGIAVSKDGKSV